MVHGNWISRCRHGPAALLPDDGEVGGGGWGEGLWSWCVGRLVQLVPCDCAQHWLKVDSRGKIGDQRGRGWLGFLGGTTGPKKRERRRICNENSAKSFSMVETHVQCPGFYTAWNDKCSSRFMFYSAICKEKNINMDLRRVVDKACWMCGPQVSSHLDYRVDWGQGEGVEVDSSITARGRVRLLKRDIHNVWQMIVAMIMLFWQWSLWIDEKLHSQVTNCLTQSVAKVVVIDWELTIYWSSQWLDRQNILWPYYVTSGGGERACRGWWWMVLRAGEEDWRGWGGVSTQRGGSVSLILHRNQHQLGKVLFTGLYIYNQTKCKCWKKKKGLNWFGLTHSPHTW